jgi:quinol monooxygenase YgiN
MSASVKIIAILTPKPDKVHDLKTLLEGMVGPSRAEPGNLRWDVWHDQAKPDRFVLDELYTDNAAVAAHRETAHFRHYLSQISDLADRTAFVLDQTDFA